MTTFPMRVRRIRDEARDIRSFELVEPDGRALPPFAAGAHIDVHVGPGLVRQYSLCNGPLDREAYLVAVKREETSRGGSHGLHDRVSEGDVLTVGAPRNSFPRDPDVPRVLLIAAGIGLTPLLSMARALNYDGRGFALHSFSRSAGHTPFREALKAPSWDGRVHLHEGLDRDDQAAVLRGILDEPRSAGPLYLCGPRAFMQRVEAIAAEFGWSPDRIHREHFAPVDGLTEGDAGVEIVLARSGLTLTVPPERSIAAVLVEAGADLEVSCEQGLCGTCVTAVIDGVPDHRDTFLTQAERASGTCIALCVSRARTPRLVLDL